MLRRGFLGWLRGGPGRAMAIVPTLAEEGAKRQHRERETPIKQRTSTIDRMKASDTIRCSCVQTTLT